jgi:BirA family biotin operon repressor/biotin-[acetyl-CoA-carboxylase] ligase
MQTTTQELIIQALLEQERLSGQRLAETAAISRTAVWKHIQSLRREGYDIVSEPGRGYRLQGTPDRLHPRLLASGLETELLGRNILFRPEIGSTQDLARELAEHNEPEGCVVVAEKQGAGRGRRGRGWTSLPGSVALSVLFRPPLEPWRVSHFPLLAGVAAARAVAAETGLRPRLKWPNDVLLNGRKAVGILAEMSADAEAIAFILLGMGLNVNAAEEDFPVDIRETATSMRREAKRSFSRVELVKKLLQELEALYVDYLEQGFAPVKTLWRDMSHTLGREVRVELMDRSIEGLAVDIDASGCLVVRTGDGRDVTVSAGDVSVKSREPS